MDPHILVIAAHTIAAIVQLAIAGWIFKVTLEDRKQRKAREAKQVRIWE